MPEPQLAKWKLIIDNYSMESPHTDYIALGNEVAKSISSESEPPADVKAREATASSTTVSIESSASSAVSFKSKSSSSSFTTVSATSPDTARSKISSFRDVPKNTTDIYWCGVCAIAYQGSWEQDKPCGENCIMQYGVDKKSETSTVYWGAMRNGKRHGEGVFTRAGNVYIKAKWNNDAIADGPVIVHRSADVAEGIPGRFRGSVVNGKTEGQGKVIFGDQSVYDGQFKDGLYHGEGTMHNRSGGQQFSGSIVEGVIEGQGRMQFADGSYYIGNMKAGMLHGAGRYCNPKGEELINGTWSEGKLTGANVSCMMGDGNLYKGEMKNGMRHGKGTLTDKNGKVVVKGTWQDDVPHGEKGMLINTKEGTYEGQVVKGKREGKGQFTYLSSKGEKIAMYQGAFKADYFDGPAKWTEFDNGKERSETYSFTNGKISAADQQRIAKSSKGGCCKKVIELPKPKSLAESLKYKQNIDENMRRSALYLQSFDFLKTIGNLHQDVWSEHEKHDEFEKEIHARPNPMSFRLPALPKEPVSSESNFQVNWTTQSSPSSSSSSTEDKSPIVKKDSTSPASSSDSSSTVSSSSS